MTLTVVDFLLSAAASVCLTGTKTTTVNQLAAIAEDTMSGDVEYGDKD
jgi:hypothetical protein